MLGRDVLSLVASFLSLTDLIAFSKTSHEYYFRLKAIIKERKDLLVWESTTWYDGLGNFQVSLIYPEVHYTIIMDRWLQPSSLPQIPILHKLRSKKNTLVKKTCKIGLRPDLFHRRRIGKNFYVVV